ncbi:hypothetical protein OWV82_015955 [Melia azedarach]|uniref:Uncharacterized protein n=1 Tax=Melia azedarach TaxID=155640 RepID=A0ACC1XUF4_MELAZ|nr:hypothetical protein OWV82_015955 [Melia azedarach]
MHQCFSQLSCCFIHSARNADNPWTIDFIWRQFISEKVRTIQALACTESQSKLSSNLTVSKICHSISRLYSVPVITFLLFLSSTLST